jgi:hypothetical protein
MLHPMTIIKMLVIPIYCHQKTTSSSSSSSSSSTVIILLGMCAGEFGV